jgi:hypothetical protein
VSNGAIAASKTAPRRREDSASDQVDRASGTRCAVPGSQCSSDCTPEFDTFRMSSALRALQCAQKQAVSVLAETVV